MRVWVAAQEERGRSGERAFMMQVRVWRADQAAGESNQSCVARGVRGDELRCKTCSLREPSDQDAVARDTRSFELRDNRADLSQSGAQVRLVGFTWREEGVRIPGMAGSLRSKVGETFATEWLRKSEDVFGRAAAAVQQHDRSRGFGQRGAEVALRLVGVRIKVSRHAVTSFFSVCELRWSSMGTR